MRNLIYKFETGTDIVIKLYQDTNTKKFAVTEFNKSTNEFSDTEWFFNYQKATDEIKNRMKKYKDEEETPNFKTYTMDDWRRDGELKIQIGQRIDDEVFAELKNNVQPKAYSKRCFQPGEVQTKSVNGEDLYLTFTLDDGWKYLGLCPANRTTPQEPMNESIKLTENEFYNLIKESVNDVINEINNSQIKKKIINKIYKATKDITSHIYKDDDWRTVSNAFNVIENTIANDGEINIWVEGGGYQKGLGEFPNYKEYKFKIELYEGGEINGSLKCHAAGSMNDPFDRYDITITLY